jgi:tetratricopeptide (TPR) repeat protein
MTNQPIYISRQQAETFLAEFAKALNQPSSQPLLFHVYGIGGVGKSTLLRKLREIYQQQVDFAAAFFGFTVGIETSLKLMATLYEQLPQPSLPPILQRDVRALMPSSDPFASLYEQYQQTLLALKTQPVAGKPTVDSEQQSAVKDLLELGTSAALAFAATPDFAFSALAKGVGMLANVPQAIGSAKDRVQQLLYQHPATKGKKELRELLLEPLPKLTQAFAQGLIHKAQKRPVVLVIDTYEKAPSEIDLWLCKYLLGNTELKSHNVRIVVAGRHNLLKTEYWRKLQQDRDLVYEQPLERFDEEQTADYLQQIGITEPDEVEDVDQATKGLPYYLNWIRREKEAGRELDFSQGNQAIVELLLQGLNPRQKQVLQLAACCRSFDKALIRHLMNSQNLDFEIAANDTLNCFEWLRQRDFVEFAQHRYFLDDVAREVFRLSLWQEDKEQFYQIHELLADYFEERANQEVPIDSPPSAQYENLNWCEHITEFLYHALFSRRGDTQRQFIFYLFASRYFKLDVLVKLPFRAIAAEADLTDHLLLSYPTRQFLMRIEPAVEYGWEVLEQDPIDCQFLESCGFSQSQIEATLQTCFNHIASLDGVAKFAALLYQSRRCPEIQRLDWLRKAKEQAEQIASPAAPEFSWRLFLINIGSELFKLKCYEEMIANCDKALAFKTDDSLAWKTRSLALLNLSRYEEAITSYDKALKIKPDDDVWFMRGTALMELGRYEEAITNYDQALQFNPELYEAWFFRGYALRNLGRHKDAIASYDKALEIKPDDDVWFMRGVELQKLGRFEEAITSLEQVLRFNSEEHGAWYYQGNALLKLGRLEEAFASYNQALKIKPDYANAFYGKACCYAVQGNVDLAIENLQQAINLNPDAYRQTAKNDSVFDSMGGDNRFQALIQGDTA